MGVHDEQRRAVGEGRAFLQEGWVIANHILVSFHVAFISSVLVIPEHAQTKAAVLRFIFVSPETLVSALFTYLVFHSGIALHELGHFLKAARLRALNESIQEEVEQRLNQPLARRLAYLAQVFLTAPYGRARGIKREGLNYYADAPYNLAVAAAGPRASRNVALVALLPGIALLAVGLATDLPLALYPGRLLLGLGIVAALDFLLADPGKYREFQRRERRAHDATESLPDPASWIEAAPAAKQHLLEQRVQEVLHPRLGTVTAPWQFRNCGMGGRHTEKEYPESNVSMQEALFLILSAADYQEAQEMTVRLQNRLKEILEKAEGCRVMGIGLEGGLAPYVDRGEYPLPEVRLWAMMKQAIEECGYGPGTDVAIALDPAMSELEIAYREEFDIPDSVGMYLFWRDRSKRVLDRDEVLAIYEQAIREYQIPILSIEDGFSEDDHDGWRKLLQTLGDRILVVGDDLVTTNDATIEWAASRGLINTVLVKANQIGTLYETLLAVLVSLGKGLQVVVSHRSKSPNDDMEAHIALAINSLGLKCGGGANTERLVKYQAVSIQMQRLAEASTREPSAPGRAIIERIRAREEPTNAGLPTVGVEVEIALRGAEPGSRIPMTFHGATPLGTSAGTGEAVHLVDRQIERSEHRETLARHPELFLTVEPGVVAFRDELTRARIEALGDPDLAALFTRANRYEGKGCLNAVDHVRQILAPHFEGADVAERSLLDFDRSLLRLELWTARRRNKLPADAPPEDALAVMQRKQNLGMNAILSASLALARASAHVRGDELYELLREEMFALVTRLASEHGVAIPGSRFEDYVTALREVDAVLEARGEPLHAAVRRVSGIYAVEEKEDDTDHPLPAAASPSTTPAEPAQTDIFTDSERTELAELDQALFAAYVRAGDEDVRNAALRRYLRTTTRVGQRLRLFEIANHRIYRVGESLIVPYDAHGALSVHEVREGEDRQVALVRHPHGTIVTDALVNELAGVAGEPIDLERQIHDLDIEGMPTVRIGRIRDLAMLIERLNKCGSRNEAVYLLRFLVARLCSVSFQGFPGAKNLQPEVARLRRELARLLNGEFAPRLRLPMRILVRNVSGLVSRPKLIDELWQDTIDLAEVHARGSAITNEIRRSAHHALGKNTLELARAYQCWLETGEADFPDSERERPAAADAAARDNPAARELVDRIVSNLGQLLGGSQIASRLAEWCEAYADDLVRCDSGNSLEEELEGLIERGVHVRNRWGFQHRLRALLGKARDGGWATEAREPFLACLEHLESMRPEEPGFDAEGVERAARAGVSAFVERIRADHQLPLFAELDDVLSSYERGVHLEAFELNCALRHKLEDLVGEGTFNEQRYLLQQLDCLLEEFGYLALRHVASRFQEEGIRLDECLRIVHLCAANLGHDGLFSRELFDLSALLLAPDRTVDGVLDALEQIQRNYHRVVHRVSVAYEVMAGHLGYGPEDLRAVLANFQRTMHDLNSIVHFADLARTHLQESGNVTLQAGGDGHPLDPWDFAHLSHVDDITRRVETREGSNLLDAYGGKGSGLLYVSYLGIPTRDGFVIPTTLARQGLHESERPRLEREVLRHVDLLEADLERLEGAPLRLGDPAAPLLLAVRGGSVFSMPGMLTTVVFVGITDAIATELAREDEWFAWDAYRRFLASYAAAAWGLGLEELDLVEDAKRRHGVTFKTELSGSAMREVVERSKEAIRAAGHAAELEELLADPERQLHAAIRAVHASWDGERARRYRQIKGMSEGWHTAVIVQQMASGNRLNEAVRPEMDERRISLTGVIPCTRMELSGSRSFTGDVKFSASGDDLVGGLTAAASFQPVQTLRVLAPMLERRLNHIDARLRRFRGTDPEIEFTVDRGVLSVLQARSAHADTHVSPTRFVDPGPPAGRGIGIRGGAFRGLVAIAERDLEPLRVAAAHRDDVDGVLLLLENPTPDEIPLILTADALLTARGGSTSHAAVAVHGIEDRAYCAVLGAAELRVDVASGEASLVSGDGRPAHVLRAGDLLSIHGQSGEVFVGAPAVTVAESGATSAENAAGEREPAQPPLSNASRP